jgi:hypothetical protein
VVLPSCVAEGAFARCQQIPDIRQQRKLPAVFSRPFAKKLGVGINSLSQALAELKIEN